MVYGAAVWWPRCKLKRAKKALDKIQRMVLGGVTGHIRMTTQVACETLLDFPLLDLWIRIMAFKANFRIHRVTSHMAGKSTGIW